MCVREGEGEGEEEGEGDKGGVCVRARALDHQGGGKQSSPCVIPQLFGNGFTGVIGKDTSAVP